MHFLLYRTIDGHSNIYVHGSEIQSKCKVIANGSSDADAILTLDFGQGSCTSGKSVTLNEGRIFIGVDEVVSFGRPYKDIILKMSSCHDSVIIAKTHSDASSIEVLGYDGDDRIVLGDTTQSFDAGIHANIIVDAGRGSNDALIIRDQVSTTSKVIAVRPTVLMGIHESGSQTISYFNVDGLNMSLGTDEAQVNVHSTVNDIPLIISTQGKFPTSGSVNECRNH